MESFDYPISHFRLMTAIAARLAILPAQLLEHSYTYHHFGSWWFTFEKEGGIFRISFDGRDSFLYLEVGEKTPDSLSIAGWKGLLSEQLIEASKPGAMLEIVTSFLEKAN